MWKKRPRRTTKQVTRMLVPLCGSSLGDWLRHEGPCSSHRMLLAVIESSWLATCHPYISMNGDIKPIAVWLCSPDRLKRLTGKLLLAQAQSRGPSLADLCILHIPYMSYCRNVPTVLPELGQEVRVEFLSRQRQILKQKEAGGGRSWKQWEPRVDVR